MGCKKSVTGLLLLIRWEANGPVSVPLDTSWQPSINVFNDIRPGSTRGVVQHKSIAAQVYKQTLNVSHYRVTWDKPGQFIKGVKVALNASRLSLQRTEQQHMRKQLCWRWQGPLAPTLHNGLFYVALYTDKERITGDHNWDFPLASFPISFIAEHRRTVEKTGKECFQSENREVTSIQMPMSNKLWFLSTIIPLSRTPKQTQAELVWFCWMVSGVMSDWLS